MADKWAKVLGPWFLVLGLNQSTFKNQESAFVNGTWFLVLGKGSGGNRESYYAQWASFFAEAMKDKTKDKFLILLR